MSIKLTLLCPFCGEQLPTKQTFQGNTEEIGLYVFSCTNCDTGIVASDFEERVNKAIQELYHLKVQQQEKDNDWEVNRISGKITGLLLALDYAGLRK